MKLKQTTSLGMAAAFMAKGAILENVDKSDPRHMIFSFSDGSLFHIPGVMSGSNTTLVNAVDIVVNDSNLDVWERAWANETLEVNAVKYFAAMTRLKSIIHSV